MIAPHRLIGLKYRLGSNPEQHGPADCLSLASAVVRYYGFTAPQPARSWYRRLRQGDYSIFEEELERWGTVVEQPRIGSVGLCQAEHGGYGLAAWYESGWLSFVQSEVIWSPTGSLGVVGCYYPLKQNCAMQSV